MFVCSLIFPSLKGCISHLSATLFYHKAEKDEDRIRKEKKNERENSSLLDNKP